MPRALAGHQWTGTGFTDSYKRNRSPSPNELLAELKGTAWTCASINASVCASNQPRLYVTTNKNEPPPKCLTKTINHKQLTYLKDSPKFAHYTKSASSIMEIVDHPLLTLLSQVNPVHNAFDLWELTTLYQETNGSAYWYIDRNNPLRVPGQIWILPSQNVTPKRNPSSNNIVDYYEYRTGHAEQRFEPNEIIHFRYPDPRDPYLGGLSPLRAAFEQVAILSDYISFKKSKLENRAIPDAIISPDEVIGEEERDRVENQWNSKMRRGGAGKVIVGESGLRVQLLNQSMGDVAALAEMGATKEDIANAFHMPLAYLTTNTNMANLIAAKDQHMSLAIAPRIQRRDDKLNEQLIPMFDPSGRMFLASEDPVPLNWEYEFHEREYDLKYGVKSINEVRAGHGLDPVPWGYVPWLPLNWKPTDDHTASQTITTEKR